MLRASRADHGSKSTLGHTAQAYLPPSPFFIFLGTLWHMAVPLPSHPLPPTQASLGSGEGQVGTQNKGLKAEKERSSWMTERRGRICCSSCPQQIPTATSLTRFLEERHSCPAPPRSQIWENGGRSGVFSNPPAKTVRLKHHSIKSS